jgi:hypothetical protein
MGVAVGDYDNDGYPDLFVTSYGKNILYHNNGDGTFTDVTAKAGVAGGGWSVSAGFFDYDNDGRLDLFVTRYMEWDTRHSKTCGGAWHGFDQVFLGSGRVLKCEIQPAREFHVKHRRGSRKARQPEKITTVEIASR